MYPFIATVLNSEKYYNKMENLHKMDHMSFYAGCEITIGHRTCPTNLAQRPTEKRFLLLNGRTMPVKNLFVVKPEESHENSIH